MIQQVIQFLLAKGDLVFYLSVFSSVALLTAALVTMTNSWVAVRRRTLAVGESQGLERNVATESLIQRSQVADIFEKYLSIDDSNKSILRQFLSGAGYYGTRSIVIYQGARLGCAVLFGLLTALTYGRLYPKHPFFLVVTASLVLTLLGYMFPRVLVSFRRDRMFEEHRQGFPDFLDLLVICVEAGIGIDGAIDRVGRELARSFPSLSRNLGFMSLELRAGRSTREALENFSGRLGIEEARSFSTLIQQSEQLGTSVVQSLRVYSEEMRSKRLARAEEKAQSLPVKLVLPLAFFIFPVILGITLMPVAIKLFAALRGH